MDAITTLKRIITKANFYALALFILIVSCSKNTNDPIIIEYQTDLQEFMNPERGFYRPFGTKMSNFKALDAEELLKLREPNPAAGGFQVGSSLTYRSYQFDTFKDKPLTADVLLNIQKDMDILRRVGNKQYLGLPIVIHAAPLLLMMLPKKLSLHI